MNKLKSPLLQALPVVLASLDDGVSYIAQDTFTDDDDVVLPEHTPDTGGPWVFTGSWQDFEIVSNKAQAKETTTAANYIDAGSADVVIECDLVINDSTSSIIFRYQDTSNYWRVDMLAAGNLVLNKIETGGTAAQDTDTPGIQNGDSLHIVVILSGNDITAELSGDRTGSVSTSNAFNNDKTKHGIRVFANVTGGLTTFDNFTIL